MFSFFFFEEEPRATNVAKNNENAAALKLRPEIVTDC